MLQNKLLRCKTLAMIQSSCIQSTKSCIHVKDVQVSQKIKVFLILFTGVRDFFNKIFY